MLLGKPDDGIKLLFFQNRVRRALFKNTKRCREKLLQVGIHEEGVSSFPRTRFFTLAVPFLCILVFGSHLCLKLFHAVKKIRADKRRAFLCHSRTVMLLMGAFTRMAGRIHKSMI